MTEEMLTTEPPQQPMFDAAFIADPYPVYQRLRAAEPVYWDGGSWHLTRYADVLAALRDPRLVATRIHPDEAWMEQTGLGPLFQTHARMMLFTDPPDHTRLRSLVNKGFTPRVVEGMRPRIQRLVDELLDQVQPAGQMDIIRDLAYPLPVTVIAELMGVPLHQRELLKRWSLGIAAFIGGTTGPEMDMLQQALGCVVEMTEYFRDLAAQRRRDPRDDLLTALALAEEQGDRLSADELIANCILLLVAGHETTTNLIGNGMLALLRHPDELRRLRETPELIATAAEELLRYDSPVQGTGRMAATDLTIDGREIKRGQHVGLLIGAANRDPAQFLDPDRLDLSRRDIRHLSFSHGPHFCVGAPLARLEGQIAISTLLHRMPDLRLATEELTWRDNFTLRGLETFPVAF